MQHNLLACFLSPTIFTFIHVSACINTSFCCCSVVLNVQMQRGVFMTHPHVDGLLSGIQVYLVHELLLSSWKTM